MERRRHLFCRLEIETLLHRPFSGTLAILQSHNMLYLNVLYIQEHFENNSLVHFFFWGGGGKGGAVSRMYYSHQGFLQTMVKFSMLRNSKPLEF